MKRLTTLALGSVLLVSCAGMRLLLPDERPWVVNASRETLEVRTTHSDGHTLKVMLYPGTSIALGNAEQPLEQIELKSASRQELQAVSSGEIQSCLADAYRNCLGWKVDTEGVKPMDRRKPDTLPAIGFGASSPHR